MITRRKRSLLVAAGVAAIVVAALASDGAYFSQSWGWVALAFLMPTTVLLILGRASVPGRLRVAFVLLTGALGAWIALSVIWSVSSAASAREVERVLVYVSVALAIGLVLRRGDGPAVAAGTTVGVTAIACYGLVTRLFPDRFETGADEFNAYRLAEPVGYWNAFGLVAAIAIVLAIGAVVHSRRSLGVVLAGAALPVLVLALYFTFSRGSWLALIVALAATVALDPRRIALLWSLLAVAAPSAIALVAASRQDALTTDETSIVAATAEGHRLAWLLALLVPLSGALAWLAQRVARRVAVPPRVRIAVALALALSLIVAFGAALVSVGGPASAVAEVRDRFQTLPSGGSSLNDRLFSLSGTGRHETIGVAWHQATAHPLVGSGAGTFEILWYENRPSQQIVRDAHSLYVEMFNEVGVVGLALLVGMLCVPVVAAFRARRSRFVAPAFGAYVVWLAAASLDWHWEMVGLTMTALLASAVCLVSAERRPRPTLLSGTRLMLVGVTGTLSVLAVWSLVGNQALSDGLDAAARKDWVKARDDGVRARSLLAWSYEPDLLVGRAESALGDRAAAREAFRQAVDKDPRNWLAWLYLAQVERGADRRAAYDRVRELNPLEEDLPGE